MMRADLEQRRWLAPEVVQTSAMDCGPAALKCLLEGHGIAVSYGRLREACQTTVDGTSIDTLEQVAMDLGLDARQVMIPPDHLPLPGSLPALVVLQRPDGMTHFVVVWRLHGSWVQVMDPVSGRRWWRQRQLLDQLYHHRMPVPAADWRDWAGSEDFALPVRHRMSRLGLDEAAAEALLEQARADPGWQSLAALDAAIRMTVALLEAGGLTEADAALVLDTAFRQGCEQGMDAIPEADWTVQPLPVEPSQPAELLLRGAVLLQVTGRRPPAAMPLAPELRAALDEAAPRPALELIDLLRPDGLLGPGLILGAVCLAAFGVIIEALLLRGLLELGQGLVDDSLRGMALLALLVFLLAMLLLEYPLATAETFLGRRLENRLRMRFMAKLPRLHDRYFSSRLTSDMAHRVYELRDLRKLPNLALLFTRTCAELLLTTAGLIWLYPGGALIAILALLATAGIWLLSQPLLFEQDMNLRTQEGALNRFYLDALLGLTPIRTHGAELAVRREHEHLLVHWVQACRAFYRSYTAIHALAAFSGVGFAVWLLASYLGSGGAIAGVLLLFYWTLRLPALGQILARTLQQYPMQRNRVLRLLEPLGAPEESLAAATGAESGEASVPAGVALEFDKVGVYAGGHTILHGLQFTVAAGEHIAIVGPSGAGKSSLVGLLLGWHRSASGEIRVDGRPLDGAGLHQLRRATAWVDPAVQIWNRSLLDNLRYGNPRADAERLNAVIEQAELLRVLEKLPDGLQTTLGEGGGLVSGGEGQRVRLGRAMLRGAAARRTVRLVILDEPFRGLDRGQRHELLCRARQYWADATLLFISHDVGDTRDFDRVLVIEDGLLIEDGVPRVLLASDTRYRRLLAAEHQVREQLWRGANWRRLRLEDGRLREDQP